MGPWPFQPRVQAQRWPQAEGCAHGRLDPSLGTRASEEQHKPPLDRCTEVGHIHSHIHLEDTCWAHTMHPALLVRALDSAPGEGAQHGE